MDHFNDLAMNDLAMRKCAVNVCKLFMRETVNVFGFQIDF